MKAQFDIVFWEKINFVLLFLCDRKIFCQNFHVFEKTIYEIYAYRVAYNLFIKNMLCKYAISKFSIATHTRKFDLISNLTDSRKHLRYIDEGFYPKGITIRTVKLKKYPDRARRITRSDLEGTLPFKEGHRWLLWTTPWGPVSLMCS